MYVDDIAVKGRTPEELPKNFPTVLKLLSDRELFAVAHKCKFDTQCVTWCGKLYSSEGTARLSGRIEVVIDTRRLVTGGKGGAGEAVSPSRELDEDISAAAGRGGQPATCVSGGAAGRVWSYQEMGEESRCRLDDGTLCCLGRC